MLSLRKLKLTKNINSPHSGVCFKEKNIYKTNEQITMTSGEKVITRKCLTNNENETKNYKNQNYKFEQIISYT